MHWPIILYIFLTLAYFLGLLLAAINELLDGSDKAIVKRELEDFWLFAAGLSTAQRLSEVLKARRDRTRKTHSKIHWCILGFLGLYFFNTFG
jgi:hypothetical protein